MLKTVSNIEYLLKTKKMSWYRLSKLTGIHESSLHDFRYQRKQDITLETAVKIAKVLEVSLDALTDDNFIESHYIEK